VDVVEHELVLVEPEVGEVKVGIVGLWGEGGAGLGEGGRVLP
jgi:hypothetical protein